MSIDMPEATWSEKVKQLQHALKRKPTLDELLALGRTHTLTEDERDEQRKSWVRGMTARCEHGVIDFEQCPDCRGWR